MTLVVAARRKEKEHICPTLTIIAQVEGEFMARSFGLSLAKLLVNRYVSNNNDMVGSALLARG